MRKRTIIIIIKRIKKEASKTNAKALTSNCRWEDKQTSKRKARQRNKHRPPQPIREEAENKRATTLFS